MTDDELLKANLLGLCNREGDEAAPLPGEGEGMNRITIHHGDNRLILKTFPDASFDSCVCDPPYELGFMGKAWDKSGIAYDVEMWKEVWRVLKPGAHLLAFGGSRTYHRLVCAIEDAGFEIRDQIQWLYGQGFPKSLDVAKQIDKAAGAERKVVGRSMVGGGPASSGFKNDWPSQGDGANGIYITAPATDLARQWSGWGTALKPAHEIVCFATKPYDLQGYCAILAQKIGGALCQLASCVKDAGRSLPSSLSGCVVGSDSVLWPAVAKCNTLADLFGLTDTLPSESVIPLSLSIGLSWLNILADLSCQEKMFTTETVSALTTELKTLNSLQSQITPEDIIRAATLRLGIGSSVSPVDSCFNGLKWKLETIHGLFAQELATLSGDELDLRPKHNPIVVARKPLEGTVIKNVLKHGTGAINVGACGVETNGDTANARKDKSGGCQFFMGGDKRGPTEWKGDSNRWPANVIHDGSEEVLACFPQESSQTGNRRNKNRVQQEAQATPFTRGQEAPEYTDGGSPARFFKTCRFRYVSKASPGERNLGCEGLPLKESIRGDDRIGGKGTGYERLGGSDKPLNKTGSVSPVRNTHPTVKPLSLMCYLTRLVTPPGGVVLDHFMGSGSTLIGAAKEGFDAVGIDLGAENCRIAEARCRGHLGMLAEVNIAAQRPQGGGENLKEE